MKTVRTVKEELMVSNTSAGIVKRSVLSIIFDAIDFIQNGKPAPVSKIIFISGIYQTKGLKNGRFTIILIITMTISNMFLL